MKNGVYYSPKYNVLFYWHEPMLFWEEYNAMILSPKKIFKYYAAEFIGEL